jgi:conjugal transfer pilus assembly protein TraB
MAQRDRQVEELRQQMEQIRQEKEEQERRRELPDAAVSAGRTEGNPSLPPYPPPPPGTYYPPGQGVPPVPPPPAEEPVQIGDIAVVSAPVQAPADKKKEESPGVYLPPSFMAATLLSGLDAPTVESAKGNPVPVLLRIKDLAVLPNSVKADLKGCFVIAEGLGNLADERAHLRLVSLSCLTHKGQSVIDQKIKGFVVDADGKIGLKGTVVSKMGSLIARSMVAGFFGGMGEGLAATSTITATSPLGTTQTIPSGDIIRYGAASGVGQAFKDVQKFYLDLARQTLPVIEVGATKEITLVIEEGTLLDIRKPGEKK